MAFSLKSPYSQDLYPYFYTPVYPVRNFKHGIFAERYYKEEAPSPEGDWGGYLIVISYRLIKGIGYACCIVLDYIYVMFNLLKLFYLLRRHIMADFTSNTNNKGSNKKSFISPAERVRQAEEQIAYWQQRAEMDNMDETYLSTRIKASKGRFFIKVVDDKGNEAIYRADKLERIF